MLLVPLLVSLVLVSAMPPMQPQELRFADWARGHGKEYHTQAARDIAFKNWAWHEKNVQEMKERYPDGDFKLSAISDRSPRELVPGLPDEDTLHTVIIPPSNETLLTLGLENSWNWATAPGGYLSPVGDQGQCGCCWSFASSSAIEASYAIQCKKSATLLSRQDPVDCNPDLGDCQGSNMFAAVKFVNTKGGLAKDTDYPFVSRDGHRRACKTSVARYPIPIQTAVGQMTGYTNMQIATHIRTKGPVYLRVLCSKALFTWGTAVDKTGATCNGDQGGHAVTLVGYDMTDPNNSYWIVKNSWTPSWGDKGYFKIAFGQCSIPDRVYAPLFNC